jgi:hypothetical protein
MRGLGPGIMVLGRGAVMSGHGVTDLLGRVRAQERARHVRRGTQSARGTDAHHATIAAVLAVLMQSSCYHWRDEHGRDTYAIVRLDRKSDAHDLCPAMYDAYYLHGSDEEGEPCTPWSCTDLWLEHHAEHRVQPWALPLRLWARACADAAENERRPATASPGAESLELMPSTADLQPL